MRAVVWLVEGTWEACVDSARDLLLDDVRLVHVVDEQTEAGWEGGPLGLMGRGRAPRGGPAAHALDVAATGLLDDAAARFGAGAQQLELHGRTETAVLGACADADLLICARDGVRTERGPRSLSKVTRYVVDHAPCAVLLVWPEEVPAGVDLPPAPPERR